MPACPSCAAEISETVDICPRCSATTPWATDVTRLADSPADGDLPPEGGSHGRAAGGSHRSVTSSGSWLTSTEAIDHGRFAPGALLDGRYRIVGRLGKGGMGEVYRADDLKLGQAVALKFLAESVDRDPVRLTQLHTEVRMARQVSHPNVCRVYDVGEYEGHTFLSMEYVDGEDLSSLLRRIGRFPEDRAIEVARQICAGLAAAHDRGVVHRDLKPANIMLDGNGRIRITDFGLAGAAGETLRAGTPAYMAPEQLAGGEVTPRSDVYSLGLVMYELFTGRRALDGRNLAEIIAKREQDGITQPSEIVRDLDPSIERAIMRCIEPEPARRPASALAVAASLPGGDPLAAALAAGETPSPAMVAAAGTTSALNATKAILGLGVAMLAIVIWVALKDRVLVTSMVPMPKPPLLLVERAKQILGSLGYPPGMDSAHAFTQANYLGYLTRHPELGGRERLTTGNPAALHFWYRGSPTIMIPASDRGRVSADDPPMTISGMSMVVMDPEGRLIRLSVVPPQLDPPPPKNGFGETGSGSQPQPVNWKPLFEAAGLDATAFTEAPPEWTPALYADTRAAWTGPISNLPGQTLRLEAAAYRGKAVAFQQIAPWTTPTRMPQTIAERTRVSWWSVVVQLVVLSMFAAAALIARHNLRKGRGDRRGAIQLAAFVSLAAVGVWLLDAKHFSDPSLEMTRFFVGQPLWAAGLLWLLYLALEPYVRRFWPATLVSWSRLMARQWRDPVVGRDILFGVALGVLLTVLSTGADYASQRLGYPINPHVPDLGLLLGTSSVLARTLNQIFNAVLNALFAVFGLVLLKMFVKREWVASLLAIALSMLLAVRGIFDGGSALLNGAAALLMVTIIVLTIQRLGLVAMIVLLLVNLITSSAVVTLDSSKWFFGDSILLIAIPIALACYGFYVSRGGEPLFGRRLLD
jgi:serine/threonine-protein kinase